MSQGLKSSAQLLPDSMQLSSKQRTVLTALQQFPHGADAGELAERLDMHINTVRGHLTELIRAGAVRSLSKPASGRGRPGLIFQVRVPDNQSLAKEYTSLIKLLTSMVVDQELTDTNAETARAIGRRWAEALAEDDLELFQHLRDMGFDPMKADDTRITLNACPFISESDYPSPFICAIHAGFISQIDDTLALQPISSPEQCAIHIRKD